MTITDIISPIFRIISDQNIHTLEKETRNLCLEDWHPVGDVGRKDKDWVQVMVKEK